MYRLDIGWVIGVSAISRKLAVVIIAIMNSLFGCCGAWITGRCGLPCLLLHTWTRRYQRRLRTDNATFRSNQRAIRSKSNRHRCSVRTNTILHYASIVVFYRSVERLRRWIIDTYQRPDTQWIRGEYKRRELFQTPNKSPIPSRFEAHACILGKVVIRFLRLFLLPCPFLLSPILLAFLVFAAFYVTASRKSILRGERLEAVSSLHTRRAKRNV